MKTKTINSKNPASQVQARRTFVKAALAMFLICSALFSIATGLPVSTPTNSVTEKTIQNYFRFPQVLIPHSSVAVFESQKVEVLFTTANDGRVNFALAKTNNPLLKQEVEKQFYNLRLPKLANNVVHSVVLNFKTQ